ncbi:MAG: LysM peptidoglycan-binding domain-containing M23 family metallopeptidase [Chloroflexi bacterium]|nr:LysM peptidoglycan-binding domain-containing M23 family metallopeptidase [Chloroflexota bacterium]
MLLAGAGYIGWVIYFTDQGLTLIQPQENSILEGPILTSGTYRIPDFVLEEREPAITRSAKLFTIIPERENTKPFSYLVASNDSMFGLAEIYDLDPESILWSNYNTLQDNPHSLKPGMELIIPPINGIYYQWEVGDDVDSVATKFETDPELIINWIGNDLDLLDPVIEAGDMVMIPDGKRDFQQWIIPTISRGAAGVSSGIYGDGACSGPFEGLYGGAGFIWPTAGHTLSGNDYWSGHLAIDIGLVIGEPVFASDSGVVVFAGWATGGYGNVVVVDHGTGYQTLYAHLSGVTSGCGQSVVQGQTIGLGGNSGNSSGAHLHFEVRLQGGFVNPWFVLPPP